jgi:hypothetical protein
MGANGGSHQTKLNDCKFKGLSRIDNMRKRKKVEILLFMISGAGSIALALIFFFHMGNEVYLHYKYSESMRGYFAIEIVNETNKDFMVNLIDNEEGELLESSSMDAMNRLTIVSRPSDNSYQLTFIDAEQRKMGKDLYVFSLPSHRYQIRLIRGGDIELEIVKNDKSTLEGYQKIIDEKFP